MKKIIKYHCLIFLQLLAFQWASGQKVTLNVVTQTIEKEWAWQVNKTLVVNGENAEITIQAWEKNTIQATINLIAKHPEKTIAERDIAAQKAVTTETPKNILLGNQLVLEKGMKKPTSNLKAKFVVFVPSQCALEIKNKFGQIKITGIKNTVRINSQFSKLDLSDIQGKIDLTSNFGDISGQELTGDIKIDANRSDIQLDDPSGNFKIKAKYGLVTILENKQKQFDLDIIGNKASVLFIDPELLAHNFRLATEFGDIKVPNEAAFEFIENSWQRKEAILNTRGNASQISVALSYGDITFQ